MATNFHRRHGSPGGYVPPEGEETSDKAVIQHLYGLGNQGESEEFRRNQAADWVEQVEQVALDGLSLPNDAGERFPIVGFEKDEAMAAAVVKYLGLTDDELEAAHERLLAKYPSLG